jgi:hypothetical protein
MAMRTRLIAVLALFSWLLANTLYGSELSETFFPLKEGMTWTYVITSDKHPTQKISITNLPPREINGVKLTPRKSQAGEATTYFLIGSDDSGIYRYGEQKSENSEPIITQPKDYYLRNPVALGTTWDSYTKLGDIDLTITLEIQSLSDEVTVPAGTFKECLKIKHTGSNQKDDPGVSVEAYEWFAPNVGLVKCLVVITKAEKEKPKDSEHLIYQLESFKP